MESSRPESITVAALEAGERIDKLLAVRYKESNSRSYFQFLIDSGRVLLNGKAVKKQLKPQEGDVLHIHFVLPPQVSLDPEPIPLDILHEDDSLLAINKPAGMVVHPAPGNWSGTFVNALLFHCSTVLPGSDPIRPGIVHRLDKDTTGVLLAAKTLSAHQKLIEQFAAREIKKEYFAICIGNPGNGTIEASIGRHPFQRKKMSVVEKGKTAVSHIETLSYNGKLSLVKIRPVTGRTHQIRIHLQHKGTPILGDLLYGNPSANAKYGAGRQLLHAGKLVFRHPLSSEKVRVEASLPADFLAFKDLCKNFSVWYQ